MEWIERSIEQTRLDEFVNALGISEVLAAVLINRGFDLQAADIVLNRPDQGIKEPTWIRNAQQAADKIIEYMDDEDAVICIFGDYDMDGITSTAIMRTVLMNHAKAQIQHYVPERTEGYGIGVKFANKLIEFKSGNSGKKMLVVTVDNGINHAEAIDKLVSNGIECVVTDHHQKNEDSPYPGCICVNPSAFNEEWKYLAGCGVAFKVAQLISWHYSDGTEMLPLAAYVAMGTIADAVPLSTENICLIKYGLEILNSDQAPIGIRKFKDYKGIQMFTAVHLGWDIGPLINACGRMGNIELACEFFFADDEDGVDDVMMEMIRLNDQRKSLTKEAVKKMDRLNFDDDVICIFNCEEYPAGIMGILAGKMADKFKKPSIVVSGNEKVSGSARSIYGFDINGALQSAAKNDLVIKCGGHKEAAGLTMRKDKITDLRAFLNENVTIEQPEAGEEPLEIDGIISLKDITRASYESINVIPYNSDPVFEIKGLKVLSFKVSGSNPNNVKLTLQEGKAKKEIWCWGMNELFKSLNNPEEIDIAGTITADFMKAGQYTINVKDMRAAEGATA
jgi:single-stranded-DNA-specific exonuclease